MTNFTHSFGIFVSLLDVAFIQRLGNYDGGRLQGYEWWTIEQKTTKINKIWQTCCELKFMITSNSELPCNTEAHKFVHV